MAGPGAPVHPFAAHFGAVAAQYDRGRPEYPQAAVLHLGRVLGLGPGRRVVELGSGTGKFTRALVALGADIVAVEPSEGMRRVFRENLPAVELRDGTAETIPLPDASADAVVVAQAFHWFRQPAALDEMARVLRPGGGLGLVWNSRDERVPWVAAFGKILDAHQDPSVPRIREGAWKEAFAHHAAFPPPEAASFPSSQEGDSAMFVDRALSVSFVAHLAPEIQAGVAEEVRTLLAEDPATRGRPTVTMPYVTYVYWSRRR